MMLWRLSYLGMGVCTASLALWTVRNYLDLSEPGSAASRHSREYVGAIAGGSLCVLVGAGVLLMPLVRHVVSRRLALGAVVEAATRSRRTALASRGLSIGFFTVSVLFFVLSTCSSLPWDFAALVFAQIGLLSSLRVARRALTDTI